MKVAISDYSGDVVAGDWTPAYLAAYDDIKVDGGEIVTDVDTEVKSAGSFGMNSNTIIKFSAEPGVITVVNCNANNIIPFNTGGPQTFYFDGMSFVASVGTGGPTVDCQAVIGSGSNEWVIINNCIFAGIIAEDANISTNGAVHVQLNNVFTGGGSNQFHSQGADRVTLNNVRCLDYMTVRDTYYDRTGGVDWWVYVEDAPTGLGERRTAVFVEGFHGDERAGVQVKIDGYKRVYANQVQMNCASVGIELNAVTLARLVQVHGGYNGNVSPLARFVGCDIVEMDECSWDTGNKYVSLETNTTQLTIKNSPDIEVQAVAGSMYTLNNRTYTPDFVQIG